MAEKGSYDSFDKGEDKIGGGSKSGSSKLPGAPSESPVQSPDGAQKVPGQGK